GRARGGGIMTSPVSRRQGETGGRGGGGDRRESQGGVPPGRGDVRRSGSVSRGPTQEGRAARREARGGSTHEETRSKPSIHRLRRRHRHPGPAAVGRARPG